MNIIFRNIVAIIAGVVVGSFINMGIIMVSGKIVPHPDGANLHTSEGLKEAMYLMQPKHFIMPFLAHALGTFIGAGITALISVNHRMKFAFVVAGWFLMGGIYVNTIMLPSPLWFTVVDLTFAYIPMSYIAVKIVELRGKR